MNLPSFHHKEVEQLFEYELDIPAQVLSQLLKLPHETLTEDLIQIINYSLESSASLSEEDFNEGDGPSFLIHATLLLSETKSSAALPALLQMLRQSELFFNFWLGDVLHEYLWETVYACGKNDLAALENYLKEPERNEYARITVTAAVSRIPFYEPERRDEVLNWYRRLLNFLIEEKDNESVFDYTLTGFIVSELTDLVAIELKSDIKQLFELDLVDESICGDWKEVESHVESAEPEPERWLSTFEEKYEDMRQWTHQGY